MRLIALSLAVLVLAGCAGPRTPTELKVDGNPTQHYDSSKAPMVMATCIIPLLDASFGVFGTAQIRPTPDGVEVLTGTSLQLAGTKVFFLVTIDAVDGGSSISGFTLKTLQGDQHNVGVDTIIQQCA
jgi:hypothetical protein